MGTRTILARSAMRVESWTSGGKTASEKGRECRRKRGKGDTFVTAMRAFYSKNQIEMYPRIFMTRRMDMKARAMLSTMMQHLPTPQNP
jgi:hypothetical protein